MRIRLPLRRSLFFVSAFLFAVVALLPLRLAAEWMGLGRAGFAAREATGSVWLGGFREVQLGSMALGDLSAQLRTLPLFIGQARVDLKRSGAGEAAKGSATISRHAFGFDDLEGRLETALLFAPLPITSLNLDDVDLRYADGLCTRAGGRVTAAVSGDIAGIALPGGLTGNVRCEGGAVLMPLASQSGRETVNIRLFGDGRYEAEVGVRPSSPAMARQMLQLGFSATSAGAYSLRTGGQF